MDSRDACLANGIAAPVIPELLAGLRGFRSFNRAARPM
jgi:hypothetical protein